MGAGDSTSDSSPAEIAKKDQAIVDLLHPAVSEWWENTFNDVGPVDQGLFTPPQRETIPLVHNGDNVLVSAPTGSGKCVLPETPMLVSKDGIARVLRANNLAQYQTHKLAEFVDSGELYGSSLDAYSLNGEQISPKDAYVYTESYAGEIITIATRDGRTVSVTPDHPLLCRSSSGTKWKPARTITKGDDIGILNQISLPDSTYEFDTARIIGRLDSTFDYVIEAPDASALNDDIYRDLLPDFPPNEKSDRPLAGEVLIIDDAIGALRVPIPRYLDPTLAELGAWLLTSKASNGESPLYERDWHYRIQEVSLSSDHDGALNKRSTGNNSVQETEWRRMIWNAVLDIDDNAPTNTPFPDWVLNCPNLCKDRFLREYLCRQGQIAGTKSRITEANELRLEQLHYLLLDQGIETRYCTNKKSNTLVLSEGHTLSQRAESIHQSSSSQHSIADGGKVVSDSVTASPIAWRSVEAVTSTPYEGPIYDFSVKDTHNFIGGYGGICLHNTLASFTAIVNDLFIRYSDESQELQDSVYCLYISPVKSLANDIHRNLSIPLTEIAAIANEDTDRPPIRHAIRHGDTEKSERNTMLSNPPHILNTTPETLAILLNAPRFRKKLRTVEYVIVDEIHSLADNKRGSHLSVSLERLEQLVDQSLTRIGCSATIEPLPTIAEFLGGFESTDSARPVEIVDCRFIRHYDISLLTPSEDLIATSTAQLRDNMYDMLHQMVRSHTTTIVFTNSRSGAERVLHQLRERYPLYTVDNSACHHGSLSKATRTSVEHALKEGELSVVTTSTSLELGIDMPSVDLVVQLGSPKSVAALLQRFGRSGHQLGQTIEGRVIVLDRDELIECAVMLDRAESGYVDSVSIPENPLDVAAQHIYGMAIAAIRPEEEVRSILTAAYPFRRLSASTWEMILRYLTGSYPGLTERGVYPKIWRDTNDPAHGDHHYPDYPVGEPLIGKRGRLARVIYFTNIGTIPSSFSCSIRLRESREWVGTLDETYLDSLSSGDVFLLGGNRYMFRYRRGGQVYVDPTSERPTVPTWYSERLPLSLDLGQEIMQEQAHLAQKFIDHCHAGLQSYVHDFPIDSGAATAISQMVTEQIAYAGPEGMSQPNRVVIEEERDQEQYERRYYFHTPYGRQFNEGCSRLLAHQCAQALDAEVKKAVTDRGFSLRMPLNRKIEIVGLLTRIEAPSVRHSLREAVTGTELFKRYFRMNAARSLLILPRYQGYEKTAQEQQVFSDMLLTFVESLDDFAVVEETYRELLEDKLAIDALTTFFEQIQADRISIEHIRVDSPSPFAFGLATLSSSETYLTEDDHSVISAYHSEVLEHIADKGEE